MSVVSDPACLRLTEPSSTARPVLAVLDITDVRDYDPQYSAVRNFLTERIAALAAASGWSPALIYADREGVAGVLAAVDTVDAILIAGGEDVHPDFYGGPAGYEREGHHFPRADEAQIAAVRRAVDRGTPTLGICRGHQLINVALGGTLTQDLGESSMHRSYLQTIEDAFVEHSVAITPESRLAAHLGATAVPSASAHHQAVSSLGTGLEAIATAGDGVIEAIQHRDAPVLGVQWHPEAPIADPLQFPALMSALDRARAQSRAQAA